MTVSEGDSVTWNDASGLHNVKFDDGSSSSPPIPVRACGRCRTFNAGGTFRYYCEAHGGPNGAGMSGTVVVNPPVPLTPPPFTLSAGMQEEFPQVAVDPNGNAVFAWTRFDGTLRSMQGPGPLGGTGP